VAVDTVAAVLATAAASLWGTALHAVDPWRWQLFLFIPLVLGVLAAKGMYRRGMRRNFLDEIGPVESAIALAALILLAGLLLIGDPSRPGFSAVRVWICAAVLMPVGRLVRAMIQRHLRRNYRSAAPTLIVGDGQMAYQLIARMDQLPEYGLRPVGILDCNAGGPPVGSPVPQHPDVHYVGTPDEFASVARQLDIEDVVVVAACDTPEERLVQMCRTAHRMNIRVWVVPRLYDAVGARARIEHLGGMPLLVLPYVSPRSWQFAVKHVLDRVVTAFGLLLISPVFLTLAVLVKLSSPGPVFFRQRRVGRDGKPFDCLKFRSMRPPSEADAAFELRAGSAPGGVEGVDRRTRIGKVMRATSLDELPQLLNVLRGEMSLVGPRPERPEFVQLFEIQIRRYGERHRVKAGVTGWAQVHGLRGQTSIADRAEWDNYYIENWSLWLDLKTLLLTIPAVMHRAE